MSAARSRWRLNERPFRRRSASPGRVLSPFLSASPDVRRRAYNPLPRRPDQALQRLGSSLDSCGARRLGPGGIARVEESVYLVEVRLWPIGAGQAVSDIDVKEEPARRRSGGDHAPDEVGHAVEADVAVEADAAG